MKLDKTLKKKDRHINLIWMLWLEKSKKARNKLTNKSEIIKLYKLKPIPWQDIIRNRPLGLE